MSTQKTLEVICPNCGHRFTLDDSIADRLKQEWQNKSNAAMKAQLRKELEPEVEKKAEKRANELAQAKIREAQEKENEARRRAAALQSKITKLERSLPADRAQELGMERQRTLYEMLTAAFPLDRCEQIKRGVAGADVIQYVAGNAGSILWESKKAAAWQNTWVKKLLSDQKNGGHSLGVIVSDVLPDETKALMQVEGVWACKIDVATDLATVLRQSVIAVANARGTAALRDDLKGQVYDYLVSRAFVERVASIVMIAQRIRDGIAAEQRAFTAKWNERERQATAITEDVGTIIGAIRGIGAPVKVDALELQSPLALPVEATTQNTTAV